MSDLLKLTKLEAQCWIALYHLTCNKLCREKYGLNAFRKEQLLRLRKFLNDVVLDQVSSEECGMCGKVKVLKLIPQINS